MGRRLPVFPAYVAPKTPNHIRDLESGDGGVVETIRNFLSGAYDPTTGMLADYLAVGQHRVDKATNQLRNSILAAQGAQSVYGGSAGKQLNQALIDKIKDDLDREQVLLMDTLERIINNRKFGVGSGIDTIDSARDYAIKDAAMQNAYNANAWQAQAQQAVYSRNSANTLRNLLNPTSLRAADMIGSSAVGLYNYFFPQSL
ncbi:MAG: hypothetical protein C4541_09185 [Candidatus Auribacter fodinae]|jgi:hypothetical protein|uniref:Uncharacterized protein n=1 Tax=Candidatus Auribacter fodinae TaxID=2093366 RepID=A0A3A4QZV2_9BACT|nr:MAG: hypothetical protein C4541_09185 [Candidatus Auribacter fodinae]